MLMKKLLAIIVLGLLLNGNAYSFYNYGEYKKMLREDPKSLNEYVYGLGSSLTTFGFDKGQYCPPKSLRINTKNYISISNDYANSSNAPDDELVITLLYVGLRITFPCK